MIRRPKSHIRAAARAPAEAWRCAPPAVLKLVLAGKRAEAFEALQQEAAADPQKAWPLALSAELKRGAPFEKYSEAFEDLAKACRLEPDRAWLWGYWARALAQAGRTAEAAEKMERALALDPRSPWLLAERALISLDLGRPEPALIDALATAQAEPCAQSHFAAARCQAALALWEGALKSADRCLACAPRDAHGGPYAASRPHSLRFAALRALGRIDEAGAALREAAAQGERLGWTSDGAPAPELDAALLRRPKDAWLHFWRGEARLRQGRVQEAEADFSRACALDASHLWARAWRGWALSLLGRETPALEDLGAALALCRRPARKTSAPLQPRAVLEWQLLALRGELHLRARRFAEARADLSQALTLQPAGAVPFFKRAQAALAAGDAAAAELDLRRSLALDPGLRPAYVLRSGLRSKRGDLEGALSDLKRAKRPGGTEAARLGLRWASAPEAAAGPARQRGLGRVCVDPRIELVGLLKLSLEPKPVPGFCREKAPALAAFVEEAQKELFPFIGPELSARFRATAAARGNAAFPWLGVTQMMMDVSEPPELRPRTPAWRDSDDLCLLRHLREFVGRSGFLEFLDGHAPALRRWAAPMRKTVEAQDYAKTVSAYVGVEIDAYYDVVFSPLLRDVSLRAILRGEDGVRGARTVHCALTSEASLDAALVPKPDDLLWTGWHEVLHLVIDPWSEFYREESGEFSHIYEGLPKAVRRKGWMDSFSEHHVRAATQRLLRAHRGPRAQEALAVLDRCEGYILQDALAERLAEFESRRDRYPALADFFPEWFKVWRQVC